MSHLKLIIGNKKYSSWSMRPWLFLKHHGIVFDEVRIPLYTSTAAAELRQYSPSGLVPVLQHDDLTVGDSLAICEYIAEIYPHTQGWPQNSKIRALARAVSAEMHAGFSNLRSTLTTNLKARYHWQDCGEAVGGDIARIEAIWAQCRRDYGQSGPWLFGDFSIADVMYAPVATRFRTYNVPVSALSQKYIETVYALPAFQEWYSAAVNESEIIAQFESTDWKPAF